MEFLYTLAEDVDQSCMKKGRLLLSFSFYTNNYQKQTSYLFYAKKQQESCKLFARYHSYFLFYKTKNKSRLHISVILGEILISLSIVIKIRILAYIAKDLWNISEKSVLLPIRKTFSRKIMVLHIFSYWYWGILWAKVLFLKSYFEH